jgi:hypothetical protein
MVSILVFQLVVEDDCHGAPYITGTYGKVGYLNGLGLGVVNAGSIELIAHGTGTDGQQPPANSHQPTANS